MRNILIISLCCFVIWSCKTETAPQTETEEFTALSQPLIETEENPHPDRDMSVGEIKEACQLISEKWLQKNIPGFDNGVIKMISRSTPDNHSSACECRIENQRIAFVIGYKKNPTNLQAVNNLITRGQIKELSPSVPPFKEVQGLGQKAAFSTNNGNLVWVTENGIYVYMYIFPPAPSTMDEHYKILYKLANGINKKFLAQDK